MWTIEAREVLVLTGGGGEPFARFVNAVIRAQCFALGVSDDQISTTVRTNYADGGVDAAVHVAAPADTTGRLAVPTAWQYKAMRLAEISEKDLRNEIQKPYAAELISKGYGYRLCICDDVPDKKAKQDCERILNEEVRGIFPSAPEAQLLTSSDLATWASRFPGVAGSIFNRPLQIGRHWKAWELSELQFTPRYVLPTGWEPHCSAIVDHIDFTKPADNPAVAVKGAAGVGKTRLVFEAIRKLPNASQLVVITEDDAAAIDVARWLVNQGSLSVILIADECSIEGHEKLQRYLRGSEPRIRAVTIDNSGDPPHGGAPGIWLKEIDQQSVERILEENYPEIPPDRRRAYADLSGGYVRIAADLCRNDEKMFAAGNIAPAIPALNEYYHCRLNEEERRAVEAVSLLNRVGCADDVKGQLDLLGAYTKTDPGYIRETAQRLKNAPGFLVRTPRYLYVTPRIIAEVAFAHAWERWADANPASFLDDFPKELLPGFEARVQSLMNQEVRSIVSAHFRDRISSLKPADLADAGKVDQLLGLIETDPKTYLPHLHRLVAESSEQELLAQAGDFGIVGTRRGIVWAAERLAAFPEFFASVEYILRRLALAESEPRIGNNATGIWRQLFRVWLSGTSVPFLGRLKTYRAVLFSANQAERDLALGALSDLWSDMVHRMGSPTVVGGRIPPHDWQPSTRTEFMSTLTAEFELLEEMLRADGALADAAWSYLKAHLRTIIGRKQLNSLQALIHSFPIPGPLLAPWLEQLDEALQYECGGEPEKKDDFTEYCSEVRKWKEELAPTDFAGRLRTAVGKDYWYHTTREEVWNLKSELDPLAEELIASPALLRENLDYLCSRQAKSALALGTAIGRKDPDASFLDSILAAAREHRDTGLLRGYVAGILTSSANQSTTVNALVDQLETDDPPVALDIIGASIDFTNPAVRVTRMVGDGRLGPEAMQILAYGGTLERTPSDVFGNALAIFDREDVRPEFLRIANDLIGIRLHRARRNNLAFDENADTKRFMVSLLRRSAAVEDRGDHWWGEGLDWLADQFPAEIVAIAIVAITGKDHAKQRRAASILAEMAKSHPDVVMEAVGRSILDPENGWKWLASSYKGIFGAIPAEVALGWLDKVGIEGARRIARHLPSPSLTQAGEPEVPGITARVLLEYGNDEHVAGEFAAGRHHLEVYTGDLAANYEAQARRAEPFLSHPVPAIRKWAEGEIASSLHWAKQWRRESEDRGY